MTENRETESAAADFDADADRPRAGWVRERGDKRRGELWVRKVAGLTGSVLWWPGEGATFDVEDAEGNTVAQGTSSRRGWAMDGADAAFPAIN